MTGRLFLADMSLLNPVEEILFFKEKEDEPDMVDRRE
jgi:hypothetical protein